MKLLIALLFAGLLSPQSIIIAKKKAVGGCSTTVSSCTPTITGTDGVSQTGAVYYKGTATTLTSGDAICNVSIKMTKTGGDISGKTYKVFIYSLSGNDLGTLLATSDAVTGSNSWSQTTVSFGFSSPYTVSSTATYAIVVGLSPYPAVDYEGTNYATADFGDNCGAFHMSQWNSSGTRSNDWPALSLSMTITKQ
jgi:hypothetical protein